MVWHGQIFISLYNTLLFEAVVAIVSTVAMVFVAVVLLAQMPMVAVCGSSGASVIMCGSDSSIFYSDVIEGFKWIQ